MAMTPTSLKEISARVVKTYSIPFCLEDLPKTVVEYLSSANCCVNPACQGRLKNVFQKNISDKSSSEKSSTFSRGYN